jgi:hypothetical protein
LCVAFFALHIFSFLCSDVATASFPAARKELYRESNRQLQLIMEAKASLSTAASDDGAGDSSSVLGIHNIVAVPAVNCMPQSSRHLAPMSGLGSPFASGTQEDVLRERSFRREINLGF